MSSKKLFSLLSALILITHISMPLQANTNKKKTLNYSRLIAGLWSTGKIGLGCYVLFKGLNNQLTEERSDDWYTRYWRPDETITQEFRDEVAAETSFHFSNTQTIEDYNKDLFRIITYWKKSDTIMRKQIKNLLCGLSAVLILTGILDIYHLLESDDTEQSNNQEKVLITSPAR